MQPRGGTGGLQLGLSVTELCSKEGRTWLYMTLYGPLAVHGEGWLLLTLSEEALWLSGGGSRL